MVNADTECFYQGQLRTTHASAPDRPLSHETRRGAAARAAHTPLLRFSAVAGASL
jgi:hypothetical protein